MKSFEEARAEYANQKLSDEEKLALFNEANALLDKMDRILTETFSKIEAKVTWLKANAGNLSPEDQALLDAQLEHEAKMAAREMTA